MEKIEMKEIVDRLMRLWVKSNETQGKLAVRMGVNPFYLNAIITGRVLLRGRNTRKKYLMKIKALEDE